MSLIQDKPTDRRFIDLTGHKYGSLFVVGYGGHAKKQPTWWCICGCGRSSLVHGCAIRGGGTTTCGCRWGKTLKERIMSLVDVDGETGCWNWTRPTTIRGYGQFRIEKTNIQAHRASFIAFNGEIPPGMCVCHRCDNPKCVNPRHLFLGTHSDNNADMRAKGRAAPQAEQRITHDMVREIKRQLNLGRSQSSIAMEMGISATSVFLIAHERTYKGIC